MTAEELIAQLQKLPPETTVLVEGYETGFDDIIEVGTEKVVRYRRARMGRRIQNPRTILQFRNRSAASRSDPGAQRQSAMTDKKVLHIPSHRDRPFRFIVTDFR